MSGLNEVREIQIDIDAGLTDGHELNRKYGRVRVRVYPDLRPGFRKHHSICDCCKNLCPREVDLFRPVVCLDGMRNTLRKCDICTIVYPLN